MIGQGKHGFIENSPMRIANIENALKEPTDSRIFVIESAFRKGYDVDKIHELTKIDKWFLYKLRNLYQTATKLESLNNIKDIPQDLLKLAKQQGFSDFQIAKAVLKQNLGNGHEANLKVRALRNEYGIKPVVKQIDTLAAEYPAQTNYLYMTYNGTTHDIAYENDGKSVVVVGSGAYRIGSSVEFDWCSVNALLTVKREGWRSVMINYNPETVSTDYDMCRTADFRQSVCRNVHLRHPRKTLPRPSKSRSNTFPEK